MTASPRTYPRLRVEATDPATPGARLAKLAYHRVAEINALARALVFRGNAPDMAATVTRDWWANETDPAPMLGHLAYQASWLIWWNIYKTD